MNIRLAGPDGHLWSISVAMATHSYRQVLVAASAAARSNPRLKPCKLATSNPVRLVQHNLSLNGRGAGGREGPGGTRLASCGLPAQIATGLRAS